MNEKMYESYTGQEVYAIPCKFEFEYLEEIEEVFFLQNVISVIHHKHDKLKTAIWSFIHNTRGIHVSNS